MMKSRPPASSPKRPDLSRRVGADARAVAGLTGAFVSPDPVYLRSTGFVLDPAGKVVVSVYSSGAIGRLVPTTPPGWCATCASSASHEDRLLFGQEAVPVGPGD